MLPSAESTHPVWTMTVNSVHLSPLAYSVHYCADTSHAWSMQCSHHVNTHVCIGQTNCKMCRVFSRHILKVGGWHSRITISKTCTIHGRVDGQVVQHAHDYGKCCCIVLHQEITQTSNLITCKPQDVYTVGNAIDGLWISVIHKHNSYELYKLTYAATPQPPAPPLALNVHNICMPWPQVEGHTLSSVHYHYLYKRNALTYNEGSYLITNADISMSLEQ